MNGPGHTDELGRLLAAAADWQRHGHAIALATVVRTWGSAPRRVGAHLLVRDDGLFEGSVSGGCVEGAVVEEAMAALRSGRGKLLQFGVDNAQAWEVGLACGGDIEIMVQPVAAGSFAPALFAQLADARTEGRTLTLRTDLSVLETREGGEGAFVRRYDPPLRLMLVGAVHIAQALVPISELLGHRPMLVDPRGLFAAGPRFSGIIVDSRWPDEALAEWAPDAASAVVTLTHDPKLDDVALAAALRTDAYYIAALGSRRTHAARLDRLAASGFGAAELARIHGPAGLDIGAADPAEIALSIAAQMIASWRARG